MLRTLLGLGLVAGLLTGAASAGLYYETVTTTQGKGGGDMGNMKARAWVDGDNAKVEFTDSKNDMMKKGTYLLTTDGGRTIYLVNPKEKTYAVWDMDAMMQLAGGAMSVVKMTYSDPKVEKLLQEDGGSMLGYPTTHYRHRTSYTMSMSVMGMKSNTETVQERDTWSTTKIQDAGMGIWLRNKPPKTGNEGLDKLIDTEMATVEGIPLKVVTVTQSTDVKKKKKTETTTTTMEVTMLKPMDVAQSNFDVPDGYKEVQLFPMGELPTREAEDEDEQEAVNPFLKKMMKKPF